MGGSCDTVVKGLYYGYKHKWKRLFMNEVKEVTIDQHQKSCIENPGNTGTTRGPRYFKTASRGVHPDSLWIKTERIA